MVSDTPTGPEPDKRTGCRFPPIKIGPLPWVLLVTTSRPAHCHILIPHIRVHTKHFDVAMIHLDVTHGALTFMGLHREKSTGI
jgi:hypothetical protein